MGSEGYEEEDEEGDAQDFPEEEAGQETPSAGSGQLDQILESISALVSSVALLQVQSDRERLLPQRGAQEAAALRRALTQAHQAGRNWNSEKKRIITSRINPHRLHFPSTNITA